MTALTLALAFAALLAAVCWLALLVHHLRGTRPEPVLAGAGAACGLALVLLGFARLAVLIAGAAP